MRRRTLVTNGIRICDIGGDIGERIGLRIHPHDRGIEQTEKGSHDDAPRKNSQH